MYKINLWTTWEIGDDLLIEQFCLPFAVVQMKPYLPYIFVGPSTFAFQCSSWLPDWLFYSIFCTDDTQVTECTVV